MPAQRWRVAFVDDHKITLEGLVNFFDREMPEVVVTVAVASVQQLLEHRDDIDVVLLDVELRDGSAPESNVAALAALGARVLLYTQVTSTVVIQRCVKAGAAGIVGKEEDPHVLVQAIREVAIGEPWLNAEWAAALTNDTTLMPNLSPREAEALQLYATGLPMKNVATAMGVAMDTVSTHLKHVREKYARIGRDARTKSELYVRAVEDGIVQPPAAR
jgi:DNA-binding NarL/FixJ family response regulator